MSQIISGGLMVGGTPYGSGGGISITDYENYASLPSEDIKEGTYVNVKNSTGNILLGTRKAKGLYKYNGTAWVRVGDSERTQEIVKLNKEMIDEKLDKDQAAWKKTRESDDGKYLLLENHDGSRYCVRDLDTGEEAYMIANQSYSGLEDYWSNRALLVYESRDLARREE